MDTATGATGRFNLLEIGRRRRSRAVCRIGRRVWSGTLTEERGRAGGCLWGFAGGLLCWGGPGWCIMLTTALVGSTSQDVGAETRWHSNAGFFAQAARPAGKYRCVLADIACGYGYQAAVLVAAPPSSGASSLFCFCGGGGAPCPWPQRVAVESFKNTLVSKNVTTLSLNDVYMYRCVPVVVGISS